MQRWNIQESIQIDTEGTYIQIHGRLHDGLYGELYNGLPGGVHG